MVATQVTKRYVFPFGPRRYHVANLHRPVPDDDTVDQQLYQFPPLRKIEGFERTCDPRAKRLNSRGQLGRVHMLLRLCLQLAQLLGQPLLRFR